MREEPKKVGSSQQFPLSESGDKALLLESADRRCKVIGLARVPAEECSALDCSEPSPYFRIESEDSQRVLCIQHVVAILEWLESRFDQSSGRRGTREKPEWRLNELERERGGRR